MSSTSTHIINVDWFWPVTALALAMTFLITVVGFDAAAEASVGLWKSVVDRKAYTEFVRLRSELRRERLELDRISAQDEFAKWAKKRRLVDKLQADFDSQGTLSCKFARTVCSVE